MVVEGDVGLKVWNDPSLIRRLSTGGIYNILTQVGGCSLRRGQQRIVTNAEIYIYGPLKHVIKVRGVRLQSDGIRNEIDDAMDIKLCAR